MMSDLHEQALGQLSAGDWRGLASTINVLLYDRATQHTCGVIGGWIDHVLNRVPASRRARVVVLRSFTVEPLLTAARAWSAAAGLFVEMDVQPFEQFEQPLLSDGGVFAEQPQAVIVAARLRELAPDLDRRSFELTASGRVAAAADVAARMTGWLDSLRARIPSAPIFIAGLPVPVRSPFGFADQALEHGLRGQVRAVNERLIARCRELPDVHYLDVDAVLSRIGYDHAFDERMDEHARQPFTPAAISALGCHVGRAIAAALVPRKKCVVLDCDNTLWGGVIGEEGLDGIALGPDQRGRSYVKLQEDLLALHKRGVILAMASKNNEAEVLEVLDRHPHQVLRREHFAATRINWNDKATSIRELADEIGVGLDSMVFMDDSAVECALVRLACPEVDVVTVPRDPRQIAAVVDRQHGFDALRLSDEDFRRGVRYQAQRLRAEAGRSAATLPDFLRGLDMQLQLQPVGPATVPRVAQLTQRTNQFNLTTRRYSESDIRRFLDSDAHEAYCVQLRDRFGDYGICGVTLLGTDGDDLVIDSLLLSCRVIGRTVEDAIVPFLQQRAVARRARALIGDYVPTRKNAQVRELYARFGFERLVESETHTRWSWNTSRKPSEAPPTLTLEIATP